MSVPILYAGSLYRPRPFVPIPTPASTAPHFVSAEIGNVDNSTVVVTFDRDVQANENDYLFGVTITFNGISTGLIAGFRQANHAVIRYSLVAGASSTDVLTWAYSGAGFIVSEADSAPLGIVAAQAVTNNVGVPRFSSAEIGAVNAFTLPVTFDQDVTGSDYAAGVTIKVNGTATAITSATRQANHAIVRYAIPVLWHGSADTITWEYNSAVGNIVAESGGAALSNVVAQSVTNNCEYAGRRDYQADMLALSVNDPVSTWYDLSGSGQDFTQTGDARPTYKVGSPLGASTPYIELDGIDDFMDGGAGSDVDNMDSFTVFMVTGYNSELITKMNNTGNGAGWSITSTTIMLQHDTGDVWTEFDYTIPIESDPLNTRTLWISEIPSRTSANVWINGTALELTNNSNGVLTDYSSTERIYLGKLGGGSGITALQQFVAIMLMTPAPNATNRTALEARLAARYGITL